MDPELQYEYVEKQDLMALGPTLHKILQPTIIIQIKFFKIKFAAKSLERKERNLQLIEQVLLIYLYL